MITGRLRSSKLKPRRKPSQKRGRRGSTSCSPSEAFGESRARLSRSLRDDQIVGVLTALDRGQGVAGESAVAQALGIPKMRVTQVVASIRPLLNLEGFQVLEHDRSTGEIRARPGVAQEAVLALISPQRRDDILGALRRGTVPSSGLDALAVGLDRFAPTLDEELATVRSGGTMFKAVRGEGLRERQDFCSLACRKSHGARLCDRRSPDQRR